MNITASHSSEPSWSRRCSTETIFSIQGKETDFVRDTSDTEIDSDAVGELEFEPATESEDDGPISALSSGLSDNEIITTKVIEVSVGDDGELQFADSEQTDSDASDSEVDLYDYWLCAQCNAENNNPLYRYCEKCFKVRKNFFPPRPKRKNRRNNRLDPDLQTFSQESVISAKTVPETDPLPDSKMISGSVPDPDNDTADPERFLRALSQDSGVESAFNSQESAFNSQRVKKDSANVILNTRKRRAESVDRNYKRTRTDYSESDSERSDADVQPILKMVSDPALTIDNNILTNNVIVNTLKEKMGGKEDMCIVCFTEPKSGVFVHGRIAHICCCYKCAVKVWAKAKRCPVCNCKVSNVLKAVVM